MMKDCPARHWKGLKSGESSPDIGDFERLKPGVNAGKFEGAKPLRYTDSPSPYQGEGDKGDGVTYKNLRR